MTREEAIARIEDIRWNHATNPCPDRTALTMAIEALKGGWIPVKKGMEIPDHEVLCCDKCGEELLGYLYFSEEDDQIVCDSDPICMYDVVAYMEKPKPYKEGGDK